MQSSDNVRQSLIRSWIVRISTTSLLFSCPVCWGEAGMHFCFGENEVGLCFFPRFRSQIAGSFSSWLSHPHTSGKLTYPQASCTTHFHFFFLFLFLPIGYPLVSWCNLLWCKSVWERYRFFQNGILSVIQWCSIRWALWCIWRGGRFCWRASAARQVLGTNENQLHVLCRHAVRKIETGLCWEASC